VPPHFATGDATFYDQRAMTQFHDTRWRRELTQDQADSIQNNPAVAEIMANAGLVMTECGVARNG
jgi:hypothetical protein